MKINKQKKTPTMLIALFLVLGIVGTLLLNQQETVEEQNVIKNELPHVNEFLSVHKNYYDEQKTFPGYNLWNGKLHDMNGKIVKEWESMTLSVFDNEGNIYGSTRPARATVQTNENAVLFKKSFSGEVVWSLPLLVHHEIFVYNNSVFVISKEEKEYGGEMFHFDTIEEIDKETGKRISSYSVFEHLEEFQKYHNKSIDVTLPSPSGNGTNYYHMNAFKIIPKNALSEIDVRFQEGNWLLSFRQGSLIFILDKNSKEIVWAVTQEDIQEEIQGQHSPQILENGNMLIFDNGRFRGQSRIVEINPTTLNIVWEYTLENFFTETQGHVQRLPNNNTLITYSVAGYVFEVTPEKEIVWSYKHQEKTSVNSRPNSKIYKMIRYPKEDVEQWMDNNKYEK